LVHRLNVIAIALPSLTQRREDIPRLARHFLHAAASELETETKVLTAEVEALLGRLAWPGNVRQLENLCRWLTVMASGREVLLEDLPDELRTVDADAAPANGDWRTALRDWAAQTLAADDDQTLEQALPDVEEILMTAALEHTGGRKGEAAALLGWGRNTLTRKLKASRPDG
jgi:two-component system nitrogen regulation response regulator GlnG